MSRNKDSSVRCIRKLVWGKIEIFYPDNNTVELRSGFERKFTVIFPSDSKGSSVTVTSGKEKITTARGGAISFVAKSGRTYRVTSSTN